MGKQIHSVKKEQLEYEDRVPLPPVPMSVFYKGRKNAVINASKTGHHRERTKAEEDQAKYQEKLAKQRAYYWKQREAS